MSLTDVKIKTKVAGIVLVLVLMSLATAGILTSKLRAVDDEFGDLLTRAAQGIIHLGKVDDGLSSVGYAAYKALSYDGESEVAHKAAQEYKQSVQQVMDSLDIAQKLLPTRSGPLGEIRKSFDEVARLTKQSVDAALRNDNEKSRLLLEQADPLLGKINDTIGQLSREINTNVSARARASSAEIREQSYWIFGVSLAIGLAALGGALLLTSKTITGPLQNLQSRMMALADGNLNVEVEGQQRGDEIGQMAKAVQVFKANGLKAKQLEAEAVAARGATEEDRARNEAHRAALAASQERVVAQLADRLSRLSDGDLTARVEGFPQDYAKLQADFNEAVAKLEQAMAVISRNGTAIRSGSGELCQAADDLSKRTEQQAASLEETAAALEEITATVKKTADGAKHARNVVTSAKGDAEASGKIVQDAVAAMDEIAKSSSEISQIIGVIDEIAFQTNLLALNAGVEAARAGEAGRGFAVVASEVRALAQRSAEAAKQIKSLISASSVQVASGVSLVGETGEALHRILEQVSNITHIVSEIAASAQEQATGLDQVNTAVNQMDQITQQNAAMVEQATAASKSLENEAEDLQTLLSRFIVGAGVSTHSAAPVVRHPSASSSSTASAHAPRGGARNLMGKLAAALKPKREADAWEDF